MEKPEPSPYVFDKLIAETRRLAVEYREKWGKPLAVTGEIARHDAARLLDLEVSRPPAPGYDALGRGVRSGRRVQIKGRAILDESKGGHRLGQLNVDDTWDDLVLVLLDERFEPTEIYEADRETVLAALDGPGAGGRRRRGALSVAKFKIIARLAWTREHGIEGDGRWENGARSRPDR